MYITLFPVAVGSGKVGADAYPVSPGAQRSPVCVTGRGSFRRIGGVYVVTRTPLIVVAPEAAKGTNTLTVSAVAETTTAAVAPGNVTATESGLNFNSGVEAMVSVSPPFGVALDTGPVNDPGNPKTVTVSVNPPPFTTTQEGAVTVEVTTARVDVAGTG